MRTSAWFDSTQSPMDNFESQTIGDTRTLWKHVLAGYQQPFKNHKFVTFNRSGWVRVTETFQYRFADTQVGPHWGVTAMMVETFQTWDPTKPLPDQSEPDAQSFPRRNWWQRLFGLSNLPKARIHNE